MKVSELSAASGVSLATIKFYLREGLLPSGTATGRNQATYDERHVHRLRLIRALTEVGKLSLRDIRRILAAAEDAAIPVHHLLGVAQAALEPEPPTTADPAEVAAARTTIDEALSALGWDVDDRSPAVTTLAHTVAALRRLGWDVSPERLVRYGSAIDALASEEVSIRDGDAPREAVVERMVVGSVLYEGVLTSLRRLAHEHHSARRG
jgi:DNA-binding transcriptional MerR regulator